MKFLCDQMVFNLGEWLRAAGYDTAIIKAPLKDEDLLKLAIHENRLLLTCDKHFLKMKNTNVIFLKGKSLLEWAAELNEKLKINWLFSPFSRCLICNELLEKADEKIILEKVPLNARLSSKNFWYCKNCKKVYWEGSHTDRMKQQLQKMNKTA